MSRVPSDTEYAAWRFEYKRRYAVATLGDLRLEHMPSLHQQTFRSRLQLSNSPGSEQGHDLSVPLPQHMLTAWERWRNRLARRVKAGAYPKFPADFAIMIEESPLSLRALWPRFRLWLAKKIEATALTVSRTSMQGDFETAVLDDAGVSSGRGYDDGRAGKEANTNPYMDKSDSFYLWYKGWRSGSADYARAQRSKIIY